MSLMDKQKAAIIRDVFLTDEHFSSNNEDELKYFQKQSNLSTKYKNIGNFTSTVLEALKDKVREDRRNLDEARKTTKIWFNRYLKFKKVMNYSNRKDRKNFNFLKRIYKDRAVGVRIRKSQLKQDEVLLNKFSEYLSLTKFD